MSLCLCESGYVQLCVREGSVWVCVVGVSPQAWEFCMGSLTSQRQAYNASGQGWLTTPRPALAEAVSLLASSRWQTTVGQPAAVTGAGQARARG